MRSGLNTHHYAERYVKRFTATPCSDTLVTTHNVSLRIREDLGPWCVQFSSVQFKMVSMRSGKPIYCAPDHPVSQEFAPVY